MEGTGRTSEGGCASLEGHAADAWNGTPPGSYERPERHAALVPGAITAEREGEGGRGGEGGCACRGEPAGVFEPRVAFCVFEPRVACGSQGESSSLASW